MGNTTAFLRAFNLYLKLLDEFRKELSKVTNPEDLDEIEKEIFNIKIHKNFLSNESLKDKEKIKNKLQNLAKFNGMIADINFDKTYYYINFYQFDRLENKKLVKRNS